MRSLNVWKECPSDIFSSCYHAKLAGDVLNMKFWLIPTADSNKAVRVGSFWCHYAKKKSLIPFYEQFITVACLKFPTRNCNFGLLAAHLDKLLIEFSQWFSVISGGFVYLLGWARTCNDELNSFYINSGVKNTLFFWPLLISKYSSQLLTLPVSQTLLHTIILTHDSPRFSTPFL